MLNVRVSLVPVLLSIAMVGSASDTSGQVIVNRGYLDMNVRSGPIVMGGTDGFSFQTAVSAGQGVFDPDNCNADPAACIPGGTVSLRATWSGGDLQGRATLAGTIYPRVDGTWSSLSVEFTGSATLPPLAPSAVITVPFSFTGLFTGTPFPNAGNPAHAELVGTGTASLYLVPQPVFPGSWRLARVIYEFGPTLPTGWSSADIGIAMKAGSAIVTDDETFVVIGNGADIWGVEDGFHFVSRRAAGNVEVSARLRDTAATASVSPLHPLSKAGVVIRESTAPSSAQVILSLKPDGEVEFMARRATGESTSYIAGTQTAGSDPSLKLVRAGDTITGWVSENGLDWIAVGSVEAHMSGSVLAGLAVTSHELDALLMAIFDRVAVVSAGPPLTNLLIGGDFEMYAPPQLGPGWTSDHPYRQVPAKSESHQPRTGMQNGACWTPEYLDCGMYQDFAAAVAGSYTLTFYATADRPGGLVGANVNGGLAATSNVEARGFGNYGEPYMATFHANAGDTIRVWMYSPAVPGYVVIDDVSLTVD